MLTPLDIHNKSFKKSLRGYDMDDVDDFLDELMKDFETLYKENLDLKEELLKEQEGVKLYKDMEETLQKTMVLAQKMSEEARENAQKESELIIAEANKRAEQIIAGAHQQVIYYTRKVENMRSYQKQLAVKLKSFLKTHLELVENEQFGEEERDGFEENQGVQEHAFLGSEGD